MAEVKLIQSETELKIFFPEPCIQLEKLVESGVEDAKEKLVESGCRQIIFEQLDRLPQLRESKIDIMIYKGPNRNTPQAIEFVIDEATRSETGISVVSAKVFIADRKEYEPRLFDILPINMD